MEGDRIVAKSSFTPTRSRDVRRRKEESRERALV